MREFFVARSRDWIAGVLIYGLGDLVASSLAQEASLARALGMALVGGLVYGTEVPAWFRWAAARTAHQARWRAALVRAGLAMLYFNPLWVARHLFFIHLFSGHFDALDWALLAVATQSFLAAIPLTVTANLIIQGALPLRWRFVASASFSCAMAIYYPLMARWVADG